MNSPQSRLPTLVDLPAGPQAVSLLSERLRDALHASELVLAPVPLPGPQVSQAHRDALIAAIAPTEPVTDTWTQLLLTTSGSTGTPKAVMHSWTAVRSAVDGLHERLGGTGDWLCALPLHTSAGFMTVARAIMSGTTAIPTESLGGAAVFTPEVFLAAHAQLGGSARTYTSLVPVMARRLLEHPAALRALATFTAVLIGGQAIPGELTARLRDAGVTVVLSYGATETCGGCVYDGLPLPAATIDITDSGQVSVSGPMVMLGYRGDDASSTLTVEPSSSRDASSSQSFTMPDLGRIDAQGHLHILGRVDDVAIVKGVNVSVTAVEAVLRDLGVSAVVCVGEDTLFAAIATGIAPDESQAAEARIRERFGLSVTFHVCRDIPLNAAGKPDRDALAAQFLS